MVQGDSWHQTRVLEKASWVLLESSIESAPASKLFENISANTGQPALYGQKQEQRKKR